MPLFLSNEQINFFNDNGYLVIDPFLCNQEIEFLQDSIKDIIINTPLNEIRGIFTTGDNELETKSNNYFLQSSDKVKIFLEEKALTNGKLNRPLELSINKIGHNLHSLNNVYYHFTHQKKFKDICSDLNMSKPLIIQSMYIFKPPEIGGNVKPHQDSCFLYCEPQSCLGFWMPLEDTNKINGCLWVLPESHKTKIINRFKLNKKNSELYYEPPINYEYLNKIWPEDKFIPLEVKKGCLVILHGNIVHKSDENKSNISRHAYTFHVIDAQSKWSEENWLQYPNNKSFELL